MPLTKQPNPQVTADDVERIVRRDFSTDEYAAAIAILGSYETDKPSQLRARVQLAALRMASKNVERLQKFIDTAKRDYRDVLSVAEYPTYSKTAWDRTNRLSDEERNRIIEADWLQYEEWLKRAV